MVEADMTDEQVLAAVDAEVESAMGPEEGKPEYPPEPEVPAGQLDVWRRPLMELAASLEVSKSGDVICNNMLEVWVAARLVHVAGLAPYKMTLEQLTVAMVHGIAVGLSPFVAAQNVCVINNKPPIYGKATVAVLRADPEFENMEEWFEVGGKKFDVRKHEHSLPEDLDEWPADLTALCRMTRRGYEPCVRAFSVAQARRAKLWNKRGNNGQDTPWVLYPTRMLTWKPRHQAMDDLFPGVLMGLSVAEDARDVMENARDVTAEAEVTGPVGSPVDFGEADVTAAEEAPAS